MPTSLLDSKANKPSSHEQCTKKGLLDFAWMFVFSCGHNLIELFFSSTNVPIDNFANLEIYQLISLSKVLIWIRFIRVCL